MLGSTRGVGASADEPRLVAGGGGLFAGGTTGALLRGGWAVAGGVGKVAPPGDEVVGAEGGDNLAVGGGGKLFEGGTIGALLRGGGAAAAEGEVEMKPPGGEVAGAEGGDDPAQPRATSGLKSVAKIVAIPPGGRV